LQPGEPDVVLFYGGSLPDEFVLEIGFEFNPLIFDAQAGIVVSSGTDVKLEFYYFYQEGTPQCVNMRLARRGKEWRSYFRTADGWDLAGVIIMEEEPASLGITLKGPVRPGSVNFDLDTVTIYRGAGVRVYNLLPGWQARLEGDGFDVTGSPNDRGEVVFDLRGCVMPLQGVLTVTDDTDATVFTGAGEYWAGDEYARECKVRLFVSNMQLGPDVPFALGEFYDNEIVADLLIENGEVFDLRNVVVRAMPLLDQSYSWVQYASYDGSISVIGPFSEVLTIPLIEAGTSYTVKIKITRGVDLFCVTERELSFLTEIGYER
jgi:hypothetical protein